MRIWILLYSYLLIPLLIYKKYSSFGVKTLENKWIEWRCVWLVAYMAGWLLRKQQELCSFEHLIYIFENKISKIYDLYSLWQEILIYYFKNILIFNDLKIHYLFIFYFFLPTTTWPTMQFLWTIALYSHPTTTPN